MMARQMAYFSAGLLAMTVPALWSTASAQTAAADSGSELQEVLVTASRTGTPGFSAPTPTTVLSSELLQLQGAGNVSQVLTQVPAFKATQGPSANSTRSQNPGASPADLRGLGAQRTLVLVNGLRVTPQAPVNTTGATTSPDLNMIPAMLVDRVEVVTGGASAQWGSDAVAGVVNILLKNRFEGVQLSAQGGISQEHDGGDTRLGALVGFPFAGDRGHLVAAIDYQKNKALPDIYSRDWGRDEYQLVSNPTPNINGQPALLVSPDVHTTLAPGGLITGPTNFSLRNYEFLPGGALTPFQFGTFPGSAFMIGGEGYSTIKGVNLTPGVERYDPYTHIEFDVTNAVTLFAEGSYSDSRAAFNTVSQRNAGITIRRDNAYLPAPVRAAMTTANLATFQMNRISYDFGPREVAVTNKTWQGSVGAKGTFGTDWSWDAQYRSGHNDLASIVDNNTATSLFNFATDAVLNNGQIVCRATVAGASFNAAAEGCVPINLFGAGSPSAAALAYVNRSAYTRSIYDLDTTVANLRGEPFSTWAGAVSIATGLEYRREEQAVTADALASKNEYSTGNGAPFSGKFDVTEGYLETVVPLARSMTALKALDFNGAVRIADYSTVGNQTTWKAGMTYEPIGGLRFRTTRSRDIRAPALYELYSSGTPLPATITVKGVNATIPANTTAGNPNLLPERADTLTLGAVVEPEGALQGLRVSLDYYDIKLRDAITNLGAANIAALCTLGNQEFCSLFTYNAAGVPTGLVAGSLNLSSFRSSGFDFSLSYQKALSDWFDGAVGALDTTLSGTHVSRSEVDLGSGGGAIERAGEVGQANLGALPRLRLNLMETYSTERFSFTAQALFIQRSKIDNTYDSTPSLTVNDNTVPAYVYVNLYSSYRMGTNKNYELFAAIDNALNKDPPPVPFTVINAPTNGAYYDKVGRFFRLGASYKF